MSEALPPTAAERLALLDRRLPRRGRLLIVPHDYPDPDALASAGALHLLLERRWHLPSRIVYTGAIARAENREMVRHFRHRLWPLESLHPPRRPAPVLLVDARPGSGNVTLAPWMRPIAVFDHHPLPHHPAAPLPPFADIRPHLGACTSILHEYLEAAGVEPPAWLAACMVYAIESETMDFTRGGAPEDRAAYLSLLPRASLRLRGLIRHAPLTADYFSLLREALANARVYGHTAWSHLAAVPNPEIVPEIADRLARLERVSYAFCTAFREDTLLVSIRSNRRNARCGAIIRAVVGRRGSGGGHDRLAAGAIPVPGLDAAQRTALLEQIRAQLLKMLAPRGRAPAAQGAARARALAGEPSSPSTAPATAPATPAPTGPSADPATSP
ncbi:MAG: DHHA1 domain-containing protein [Kiritimatiellae bacterium]|nr:DHHA1 domain-containing protein [Kiritimatiellia bacterium]